LLAAPVSLTAQSLGILHAGTRLALIHPGYRGIMKTIFSGAIALLTLLATTGSAQGPAANADKRLLALVQEVQAQQAQITSNQDKIDTKVADVAEAIRVARIFAGRGGH
jgi:hypothetical protein